MVNSAIFIAGAVALAFGGLTFVALGGDSRATQRRMAIAKTDTKTRAQTIDRTKKKQQIAESLAELEKKSQRKRVDMQTRIEQAGMTIGRNQFLMIFAAIGAVLGLVSFLKSGSPVLGVLIFVTVAAGMPNLTLARMRTRRIKKFIDVMPTAMDIITRGIRAGLPLGDTLRIIANESQEPVKSEFRRVIEQQQLGISIPEAIQKMALRVPATETNFFAIVIEIQSKAGGNLSEAIGNLSKTIRERKKMRGKIGAMSMEALASAGIIALVPFLVTGALYVMSPEYMGLLFNTNHGRIILVVSLGWMSIGGAMMKKMISFDF